MKVVKLTLALIGLFLLVGNQPASSEEITELDFTCPTPSTIYLYDLNNVPQEVVKAGTEYYVKVPRKSEHTFICLESHYTFTLLTASCLDVGTTYSTAVFKIRTSSSLTCDGLVIRVKGGCGSSTKSLALTKTFPRVQCSGTYKPK